MFRLVSKRKKKMVVGFNIGSISVKRVELDSDGAIIKYDIQSHQGQPREIIGSSISEEETYYGVSGHFGHISESRAIERALEAQTAQYDAIISLGGEAFAVYLLRENRILNVLSHNRCAAGSGEFLVQQVSRLNLTLEEAIERAKLGKQARRWAREFDYDTKIIPLWINLFKQVAPEKVMMNELLQL